MKFICTRYLLPLFVFPLIFTLNTEAQIGRILKNTAKEVMNNDRLRGLALNKVTEELSEIRDEYDSSSFNYAIALSDNAGLFESKERFERHQKFLLDYLDRQDGEISEEDQARGWVDRSELLYANGKYKLALGLLIGAKAVYESNGQTESIDYARTIANLSLVSHSLGRLQVADSWGWESLEMRKELFGESSRGYAASLNNVALIQKDLGNYQKSQEMLNEAVEKNREILGEESMGFAIATNNMGALNQLLGRYELAETNYLKALDVAKDQLKEKSGNYQRLQINLALLYKDMGRYDEAEKIYLNAIQIKKKRFGESHPDYAHLLNNLASLYMIMERYDEVEELLKKSVEIYESKLGDDSPATASAKSDLAAYYLFSGRYMESLNLLKKVESSRLSVLGPEHPATIQSKEDIALARWKLGQIDQAKELYQEVLSNTYQTIEKYFVAMSEHEKTRFWSKLKPRLHRFYSFVEDNHSEHPDLLIDLFELQVSTKALLMNSTNKIKNEIMNGDDEELKQKYLQWIDQKESLSHYYTYSKEELAEENINIDSLEAEANSTERYLSANSNALGQQLTQKKVSFSDLSASMDSKTQLVEIIHAQKFENSLTSDYRYMALVVSKGVETPQLITIENGNELDKKFFKYYTNVIHNKMDDQFSYGAYWKDIDEQLSSQKNVVISPDGVYNQLNISTLKDSKGTYMIDKYPITIVSNPKDILNNRDNTAFLKSEAILVGYPIYGGDGSIQLLPGTKREVETIESLLGSKKIKTRTIIGQEAKEGNIKSLVPKGILHIATHGFFLPEVNSNQSVFGINTEKAADNPLLRSGLMFTDAGLANDNNKVQGLSTNDDGILTSYEAMNMSLEDTELIILSACETGLGEIQSGEGVYGLQRAFTVAGAENLIMSLWKVDDDATQKLMSSFYKEIMLGKDISSAFRTAQRNLKKSYPSPFYWGAFIYVSK